MKRQHIIIGVVALVCLLVLTGGLTMAQGPDPESEEASPQGTEGVAGLVNDAIPIQGQLTGSSGNPISGTVSITFTLYTASVSGTIVCQDNDNVVVVGGLFNAQMDYCSGAEVSGQALWLGIQVAGEAAEMTPRQEILPVPYAHSLRPGAVISGTQDGILTVRSTGTGDADGLVAYGGDSGEGVTGISTSGSGVYGNSETGFGVYAVGGGSGRNQAALRANNTLTTTGMAAYVTNNSGYATAHFANAGDGEVLYLQNNGGPFIEARNDAETQVMFNVNYTGTVSQQLQADGLVKAGVFVDNCGTAATIERYFNNVNTTAITVIPGASAGICTVDFGFDVSGRYVVVTSPSSTPRIVTFLYSATNDRLELYKFAETGTAATGDIMVLVY